MSAAGCRSAFADFLAETFALMAVAEAVSMRALRLDGADAETDAERRRLAGEVSAAARAMTDKVHDLARARTDTVVADLGAADGDLCVEIRKACSRVLRRYRTGSPEPKGLTAAAYLDDASRKLAVAATMARTAMRAEAIAGNRFGGERHDECLGLRLEMDRLARGLDVFVRHIIPDDDYLRPLQRTAEIVESKALAAMHQATPHLERRGRASSRRKAAVAVSAPSRTSSRRKAAVAVAAPSRTSSRRKVTVNAPAAAEGSAAGRASPAPASEKRAARAARGARNGSAAPRSGPSRARAK